MRFACFALVCFAATAIHAKSTGLILNLLIGTLISDIQNGTNDEIQLEDVTFFLYTRKQPNQANIINQNTINLVNKRNQVKFVIHGWLESASRTWYKSMTDEYLKKGDYNIIQVDWSTPASKRYDISARSTRTVGAMIGQLIVNLYINYGVPLANFHIIGHSLGAHVSGFAGKEVFRLTGSKVPRITALDAAGPLFEVPPLLTLEGLERTDAVILDAIHTDAGVFGYRRPIGTVDFYPNGGTSLQPGCPFLPETASVFEIQEYLDNLFCSHTSSYIYFIRSINDRRFTSTKCNSWNRFKSGRCSNNLKILMGDGYTYTPAATGTFYLRADLTQ